MSNALTNTAYAWHPGSASVAYTANGLDQFTTINPPNTANTYNDDANTITDVTSGNTFHYDDENRLISATAPTGVALTYDALGRLQTSTPTGGSTDTLLYAGSMLVGEYDSSGNIVSRYVPGPAQDEAALWYSGAGTSTPQWLHADALGSTIAWSNASGGSLGTLAYDPWGQPSAWSGPRYAYTGQLMIPEADLYHYKARA